MKEGYSKEKAAEYYLQNKEAIKEKSKIDTKTCQKEKKTRLKSIREKDTSNWFSTEKEALQNKWVLFLLSIRMSEKTLKFDNIRVNKKEFHKSKQTINLDLVNVD